MRNTALTFVLALVVLNSCNESQAPDTAVPYTKNANSVTLTIEGPTELPQYDLGFWSAQASGVPAGAILYWQIDNGPLFTTEIDTLYWQQVTSNFVLKTIIYLPPDQAWGPYTKEVSVTSGPLAEWCFYTECDSDISDDPTGAAPNQECQWDAITNMPSTSLVRWKVDGVEKQFGQLSAGAGTFTYTHPTSSNFYLSLSIEHPYSGLTKHFDKPISVSSELNCNL